MECSDHSLDHIQDSYYREHEISIYQCNNCNKYIVDVRSDNFDGEMLSGFIVDELVDGVIQAIKSIDKHEIDKILLINVPF